MMNKKSRILVLGGSGQVGSSLCKTLTKKYQDISILRKSDWIDHSIDKNIKLISMDLFTQDENSIKRLLSGYDVIFHLAANTEVQNSLQIENENLIKQVSLLNKLLLSMIDTNKILIFSSSCSVYAGSHDENININSKAKPVTSYDLVKSISDKLIEYYKETHNVKCAPVRFSNIYGPDKELAKKTNRRILNILLSEMHINNMVEIVSDGKFYRNYIHVNDASRMLINIANNINTEQAIFIGCSKQNIYFIDAIKILADLYSREFKNPVKITTGRKLKYKSDVRSFKVQPSKIFLSHFNYEYDLKKGFQDLLKNTKF